ncbi:hypothetical protein HDV03_002324 [Kappamyces sp. JEL0829]|nr:hypothetical protein HDV03_002324 [Kappamyces sp. JEL0829]
MKTNFWENGLLLPLGDTAHDDLHAPTSSLSERLFKIPSWITHPSCQPAAGTKPTLDIPDLKGRSYLVTGGNAGIGFETCLGLCQRSATVYLAARNPNAAQEVLRRRLTQAIDSIKAQVAGADLHFVHCDLDDLSSVQRMASQLTASLTSLDVICCNAAQGIEQQMGVNHVAHFYLVSLLLPLLQTSTDARVVVLSSVAHRYPEASLRLNSFQSEMDSWQRYSHSKLANVLFVAELHRRFGDKLTAVAVHPGVVKTNLLVDLKPQSLVHGVMMKFTPLIGLTPREGSITPLFALTHPNGAELKGKYLVPYCKTEVPSDLGRNAELAQRLWLDTEELIATHFINKQE